MNSDEANSKVTAAKYTLVPNDSIHQDLHESDLSTDEDGQPSSTAKPHHRTKPLARDEVSTGWSMVHTHGVGLRNTDTDGKSLNICYINGVIQCLANTAPLAQWLLDDRNHRTCKLLNRQRHNRMQLLITQVLGYRPILMQRDQRRLTQRLTTAEDKCDRLLMRV